MVNNWVKIFNFSPLAVAAFEMKSQTSLRFMFGLSTHLTTTSTSRTTVINLVSHSLPSLKTLRRRIINVYLFHRNLSKLLKTGRALICEGIMWIRTKWKRTIGCLMYCIRIWICTPHIRTFICKSNNECSLFTAALLHYQTSFSCIL